jgi:hypothetical protein
MFQPSNFPYKPDKSLQPGNGSFVKQIPYQTDGNTIEKILSNLMPYDGVVSAPTNSPVVHAHVLTPSDKKNTLSQYQLVIATKYIDPRWGTTNCLPIYQVNDLLRALWIDFMSEARNPARYPQSAAFLNDLKEKGDEHFLFDEDDGRVTKHDYYVCTLAGILKRFNFLGALLAKGSTDQTTIPGTVETAAVIGTRKAWLFNVWSASVEIGTRLFLIVRRTPDEGFFQIIPHAIHKYQNMSPNEQTYTDLSGRTCRARVISVGTVTGLIDKQTGETSYLAEACGINAPPERAMRNTLSLGKIEVEIGF